MNTQHQLLGIIKKICILGIKWLAEILNFSCRPFYPEVPSSAAMSEMQTELSEMKTQILELKRLMRTSFDLQLEIQRAIRQEVAAALSSACASLSLSSMPTGKI